MPTSDGVVLVEATLLDDEWEGGLPSALWSLRCFKPDDEVDDEEEYITFLTKSIQSPVNGYNVNLDQVFFVRWTTDMLLFIINC